MLLAWLLVGCGGGDVVGGDEACGCEGNAKGVVLQDVCACLAGADPTVDPVFVTTFHVAPEGGGDGSEASPWGRIDWSVVDEALGAGSVLVRFAPGAHDERVEVLRSDVGENRVVLDGGGGEERAVVPGVRTGFEAIPRHRVTVRGFEVTGSRDKGIQWIGGDGVVIEDNVIHDNRGTPALSLEYSNRVGFTSSDLLVQNNQVYDQRGECIYIGGSEGRDEDSHVGVVVRNNLVHGCRDPFDTKHDGINIKDRITDVLVERNVVIGGDWGIEVASAGVYRGNLSIAAEREGFHVSDGFQALPDMRFEDNVALFSGDDGVQLTADNAPTGAIVFDGLTLIGAGESGFTVGGTFDVDAALTDVAVLSSPAAFDGWGQGSVVVDGCRAGDNEVVGDRMLEDVGPCETAPVVDLARIAGPDGWFFTDDDPWLTAGGARLSR